MTRALPRLSLICFERNATARAFYVRRGFLVEERRPVVPHPTLHHRDCDALLMVRSVMGRTHAIIHNQMKGNPDHDHIEP